MSDREVPDTPSVATVVDVWEQDSPIGTITIGASVGAVVFVEFGAARRTKTLVSSLGGHRMSENAEVRSAFDRYFEGDHQTLDETPIDLRLVGSAVHRTVLATLREQTPFGQTTTYGQLADRSGIPGAAQLVGQIMGSSPLPVVVPCHRVVAADGSLGGFSGGLDTKRSLFRIEGIAPRIGGWGHPGYEQPRLF